MINSKIHDKLIKLTNDEILFLDDNDPVKIRFESKQNLVIDSSEYCDEDELIGMAKHKRFIFVPEHSHNYIEMVYVYRGQMNNNVKGSEVTVKKGELILLNQHILHEVKKSEEEDIIINFIIKPSFFNYLFNLFDKENTISKFLLSAIYKWSKQGEYLYFKVSKIESIQEIVGKVIEEFLGTNFMKNMRIKLLMGLLISELLNYEELIDAYSEEDYDTKFVLNIIRYIEDEYDKVNLKNISKKFNQPQYKVSKLLKSYIGLSFKELLQEKRLEKSIELLKNSTYSIEEIIKMVGYENATYFYKIFKNKYKMSLKKYRNLHNKTNKN